jgi:hypothetical protein
VYCTPWWEIHQADCADLPGLRNGHFAILSDLDLILTQLLERLEGGLNLNLL